MRRCAIVGIVVAVIVAVMAVVVVREPILTGLRNTWSTPVPVSKGGRISTYTSTEMGSQESIRELVDVKNAGFNSVVAYGSMNGRSIEAILHYLDQAKQLGISVDFSVKDILGDEDTDTQNEAHHRSTFAAGKNVSTDAQIDTITTYIIGHDAVRCVLISDERPNGPEDLDEWLPYIQKRTTTIGKVKPTCIVLYWNKNSRMFYKTIKQYVNEVQIDYYPHPENTIYGPVGAISEIGDTLYQTAGAEGTFVLQAFGWDPKHHPEGVDLGFGVRSAPPTVAEMVNDAMLAVKGRGRGGAMNLAFYAFGEPNAASPADMKEAIRQIRASDWWRDRGTRKS